MLIGHRDQVATLRAAIEAGRLHHAWLLAGPPGIGKATFARFAAAWLLARAAGPAPAGTGFELDPEHPSARLLAADSHLDYRLVERIPNPNARTKAEATLRREIAIDQIVRRDDSKFEQPLAEVLRTTPALSEWRVVIIDSLDELNRNAANALLKYLEEPPPGTLFLCISHSPGRLLPTLRSRCRVLRFQPLADAEVEAALIEHDRALAERARRDREPAPTPLGDADRAALLPLAEGAPGRALRFALAGVAELRRDLDALAAGSSPATRLRAFALAKSLAGKTAAARYEAFLQLAPAHLAATARHRRGPALARAITAYAAATSLAADAVPLSLDPQAVAYELAGLVMAGSG